MDEPRKRDQVNTTVLPYVREKLEELKKIFPGRKDGELLKDGFLLGYQFLKSGHNIHSVHDAAKVLVREEIEESKTLLEDSPIPEMIPFELVGEVAAGKPIDCEIETEIIPLPKEAYERYKAKGGKLVRVRGDSMKEAGIKDGELIIFRPQKTAENGQIVVADIKGDGTVLKKFHAEKGMVVLTSMNADYAPLLKKAGEVVIHGLYLDSVRFS